MPTTGGGGGGGGGWLGRQLNEGTRSGLGFVLIGLST